MSEIIYLYISRAKDDTVAENLLIYVYPPYTLRITEIKYIYLTPILHTYTSHSIRRHTLYTSSTQPIRVYAYCVDTHWHAAHYSPPAFDRPRSKSDVSDETRRRRRRREMVLEKPHDGHWINGRRWNITVGMKRNGLRHCIRTMWKQFSRVCRKWKNEDILYSTQHCDYFIAIICRFNLYVTFGHT